MNFETWITFVIACFLLSAIPGPSVLVITSQAISSGKRSAIICILGEFLGGICLMVLSLLGVGAFILASPIAFIVLKWAGVVYLLFLGATELKAAYNLRDKSIKSSTTKGSFNVGFWTALFNPKSLVFYLAFFTQFVDVTSPLALQYTVLIATAASVAGLVLGVYAMLAERIRNHISSTSARRKFSGLSGIFYIAGGVLVAVTR
ncbi:MAG: LysE family translocator [Arenicellales bacterium WSBS_2016_MAG_OTU3]